MKQKPKRIQNRERERAKIKLKKIIGLFSTEFPLELNGKQKQKTKQQQKTMEIRLAKSLKIEEKSNGFLYENNKNGQQIKFKSNERKNKTLEIQLFSTV